MSTRIKFTPGPWEAHIGEDYFTVYNSDGSTVVPECRCDPNEMRDLADAQLIAAAPEMYAALDFAHSAMLASLISGDANSKNMQKAREAIRSALAKAKLSI